LPKNEFIIIGQITFRETRLTSIDKTMQIVYSKAAQIGGDAVLVSSSQIQWMNYSRAVTSGSANVYNYGYSMTGAWSQTTNTYQAPIPVARYYYLYVLRWKNRKDVELTKIGDAVPATTPVFGAQAQKPFTLAMAQREMEEIESLFSEGEYNSAVARLAALKNSIDTATAFDKKDEYLARIHFLWGAYFVITKKPTVAVQRFETVLKHDPEFIPTGQFSDKIMELFGQVKRSPTEKPTEEKSEAALKETPTTRAEASHRVFFKGLQVRVVKEGASLKVEPEQKALSIRNLPLGALLTVEGKVGDWIKIKLPPNNDGIIVMGYIHVSFVKPEIE
jgi:hypothetical protein